MAAISSPGLGSGLDVNNIVQQLVELESRPLINLDQDEAQYVAKLSAYGTIKSGLADFQSKLAKLKNENNFSSVVTTQDDTKVFSTSATSEASDGSFSVDVKALAKAHKISSTVAFASISDTVGTGTLNFSFGKYDSGANTFTTDSSVTTKTVTIDSSNNSVAGIRDAVNSAKIGVTASILNDGTGNRLVFTSDKSGASNGLRMLVTEDGGSPTNTDTSGLSQLAYDPTAVVGSGKNQIENIAAQDSHAVVDGFNIFNETNTVSDVIAGITLQLKTVGEAEQTVKVSKNSANATTNITAFVNAYNDLSNTIKGLSGLDPVTKQGGLLLGDSAVRDIQAQMRELISETTSTGDRHVRALVDVGITTNRDGTLLLDSSELSEALEKYPDEVTRLFATGFSNNDPLIEIEKSGSFSESRNLSVEVTQLATSGRFNGAGVSGLTLSEAQTDFSLVVDGVSTGSFSITAKTYASVAEIAQELQTQINSTGAMTGAKKTVAVADDGTGKLVITSSSFGSSSTIALNSTTGSNAVGLTSGTATAGGDVAGLIGGVVATGSGQSLDSGNGVKIKILGGALGTRSPVMQYRGIGDQMDQLVSDMLGSTGALKSRENGVNSSIEDIADQRLVIANRIETFERNIRARFTTLDTLVAQLNNTSSFLTGQLDIISEIVKGTNK